jgi:predicted DNA repair protein MutK
LIILRHNQLYYMASGFFAVLDDIAALMDDVALTAKVATQKTAGILGDDLAVNAEKSTGFVSSREIPVLIAITKGSLINKLIIVPAALLLNIFFPLAIKVVLVLGGFYLAYEGVEKIVEFFFHRKKHVAEVTAEVAVNDLVAERTKVKSAIRTDFVLSVEIVIIALSTVLTSSMAIQIATVSVVSLLATVFVYGIVALIVRMDDVGFRLIAQSGNKGILNMLGAFLVKALPVVIKILAVAGTIALVLVSGGIFTHNIPLLHDFHTPLPSVVMDFATGLVAGLIMLGVLTGGKKLVSLSKGGQA